MKIFGVFILFLLLMAVGVGAAFDFSPNRVGKFFIGYATDKNEQVTYSFFAKTVPCPTPGPDVLVLVPMGQSNAGNTIKDVLFDLGDRRIVNFYAGGCTIARDPLVGNAGLDGSIWSPLAAKLLKEGRWSAVVISAMAVGGTRISRWRPGGNLAPMVTVRLRDLAAAGYDNVNVLWHQGESDWGSDPALYERNLRDLIALIRSQVPRSNIFVARTSICGNESDRNITAAQARVIDPAKDIYAGPDTDQLGSAFRADGCHFNARGATAEVEAWFKALNGHLR